MKKNVIGILVGMMLFIPAGLALEEQMGIHGTVDRSNTFQSSLANDISILLYTQPGSPGIYLDIQNIGTVTLTDISWNFKYKTSISGKGVLLNKESQRGLIDELEMGETHTISFTPFTTDRSSPIGLGNVYLNASVSTSQSFVRVQQRAFLFLIYLVMPQETYRDIPPVDVYRMMLEDMFDMIIDVSPEYEEHHLPEAVNFYIGDGSLDDAIPTLGKNLNYLVYCHVDSASVPGAQKLVDAGITDVYRLEGNFPAWVDAGYPIARESGYIDVTAKQAKDLIDNKSDLIVIDVSPFYADGHIPGAVNYYIGDGSLDAAIPLLDKDKEYLVYCHADSASISGSTKLVDAGFDPVYRLEGNFQAWADAGYPIE